MPWLTTANFAMQEIRKGTADGRCLVPHQLGSLLLSTLQGDLLEPTKGSTWQSARCNHLNRRRVWRCHAVLPAHFGTWSKHQHAAHCRSPRTWLRETGPAPGTQEPHLFQMIPSLSTTVAAHEIRATSFVTPSTTSRNVWLMPPLGPCSRRRWAGVARHV